MRVNSNYSHLAIRGHRDRCPKVIGHLDLGKLRIGENTQEALKSDLTPS
jgi:hypothetical protein